MGGIVGAFRRDGLNEERALVVRQTERLASRGPDDGAVYLEGPVALGYRRLDAEGRGHQPHWDDEGRVGVVFDGELDDADELARELERCGHRVTASHGADVVLAAYREWGDRCAEHLRGAFAFAVLDRGAHHILLARDRLGRRPLYYHFDDRRFVFASEVDTLLDAPGVPRLIDPRAVARWFACGWVAEPCTMVRDVWAVPPGGVLLVTPERVQARRFEPPAAVTGSPETAMSRLRVLLETLVDGAARDDPVVLLSGGRVSSFIAAQVRRCRGGVRTFGLPGLDPIDSQYRLHIARELDFDHVESELEIDPLESVRTALRAMDLPIASPAFVGHGAVVHALTSALKDPEPVLVGYGAVEAVLEDSLLRVDASATLSPEFRAGMEEPDAELPRAIHLASSPMRIVDRLSVLAERPFRTPLVAAEIIAAVDAVGAEKVDWSRLARGSIPTPIAVRAHRRSPPDLGEWMRGPINRLVEELLFQPAGGSSGLLDRRRLRWWWYQHQLGLADRSALLWPAVVFEHWYRTAIGRRRVLPERRRRRRRRSPDGV